MSAGGSGSGVVRLTTMAYLVLHNLRWTYRQSRGGAVGCSGIKD